jgi:hypothetical protein
MFSHSQTTSNDIENTKSIFRRYELYFNQKQKKYTPNYLSNLSDLLMKKTKDYFTKRKDVLLRNDDMNIKSLNRPKWMLMLNRNNSNVYERKRNVDKQYMSERNNTIKINNNPYLRKGCNDVRIIEPSDDEFLLFEPKLFYNSERVLKKLKKETKFCYSKDRIMDMILKNKIKNNLKEKENYNRNNYHYKGLSYLHKKGVNCRNIKSMEDIMSCYNNNKNRLKLANVRNKALFNTIK